MASIASLRHVSIGQYIAMGSVVHRLDPRGKLICFGLLIIATVAATTYTSNVLLLAAVLGLVLLARLPVGYLLSTVKPAVPVILILALMQLLFYGGSADAALLTLSWGPIHIVVGRDAVRMVVTSLLRFLDLLFLTSLLTNTTTNGELTRGLESVLSPLNALHLPGHELAMIGAIALRFVPILGEQMESILMARESRGVGVGGSSRWRVVRNAQQVAALIVPLFVDAYRRSEEMMLAMQARCYRGGRGRTHLLESAWRLSDALALGLTVLLVASVLALQHLPFH